MEVSRNNCRAVLCSFPLHEDWRKIDSSVNREPQGNWRWNSNSRDLVAWKLSFLFPPHHQSTPESLLAGYLQGKPTTCTLYPGKKVKALMSQRPKWPKLIRVSLVWSIPRSILSKETTTQARPEPRTDVLSSTSHLTRHTCQRILVGRWRSLTFSFLRRSSTQKIQETSAYHLEWMVVVVSPGIFPDTWVYRQSLYHSCGLQLWPGEILAKEKGL